MKKIRKIISVMLAGVMAVSSMLISTVTASAAMSVNNKKVSIARVWDGTADISWYTGKKDSYDIYTAEQFAGISELCNRRDNRISFKGVTINLMNDIVLNDVSNYKNWGDKPPKNSWVPAGDRGSLASQRGFEGCLNGNGHTITGLYYRNDGWNARNDGGGIFRYTYGAVLTNLRFEKGFVLAPAPSAALVAMAEATYIENIEVEDMSIYAGKGSGAIVGQTADIDFGRVAATIGQLPFMAFGYFINPLILNETANKNVADTYLVNCKAKNCVLTGQQAGGLIGHMRECTGVYNCLVESNYIDSTVWRNREGGAIYGLKEAPDFKLSKCYEYNTKKPEKHPAELADGEFVTTVKKSALTKSSLAKKLGEGFEYVKGESPRVKAILDTPVDIVLSGKKAKISWEKVANATKYKVYTKNSAGKFSVASTTKNTTATLSKITKGKSYEVMIRAYFKDGTYKVIDGGKFKFQA